MYKSTFYLGKETTIISIYHINYHGKSVYQDIVVIFLRDINNRDNSSLQMYTKTTFLHNFMLKTEVSASEFKKVGQKCFLYLL